MTVTNFDLPVQNKFLIIHVILMFCKQYSIYERNTVLKITSKSNWFLQYISHKTSLSWKDFITKNNIKAAQQHMKLHTITSF